LPLSVRERGNKVASYQWGYDNRYAVAECKNATTAEFFYQGFEEVADAAVGSAHTGTRFQAGAYTVSWALPNARPYVLSYWARENGTWRHHQLAYRGPTPLTSGDAYDDVRICPQDAQLTTYAFDPLAGMTSQTDPSGRTTFYEYDALGRLLRTRDDQGRILSQQRYHYARP
jgi:YD repeat-containing protein